MNFAKSSMILAAAMAYAGTTTATDFSFETQAALDAFNGQAAGASLTIDGITLSTAVVQAPEFDNTGALTGSNIDSLTSILNLTDGIAIDNASIDNPTFLAATGGADEDSFLSSGEILGLVFDVDVFVTGIEFFGIGGNETVTVEVAGIADAFLFESASGSDSFTDPFGSGVAIAAGSTISFVDVVDSQGGDARYAIESISVEAVPEPASIALLGLGSLLITRRRRA